MCYSTEAQRNKRDLFSNTYISRRTSQRCGFFEIWRLTFVFLFYYFYYISSRMVCLYKTWQLLEKNICVINILFRILLYLAFDIYSNGPFIVDTKIKFWLQGKCSLMPEDSLQNKTLISLICVLFVSFSQETFPWQQFIRLWGTQ